MLQLKTCSLLCMHLCLQPCQLETMLILCLMQLLPTMPLPTYSKFWTLKMNNRYRLDKIRKCLLKELTGTYQSIKLALSMRVDLRKYSTNFHWKLNMGLKLPLLVLQAVENQPLYKCFRDSISLLKAVSPLMETISKTMIFIIWEKALELSVKSQFFSMEHSDKISNTTFKVLQMTI